MSYQCPGAQGFKHPKPEFIRCSSCGEEVEIWADEVKATCPKCKKTVTRQQEQSCLDWCKYARECLGEEAFKKFMQNKKAAEKKTKRRRKKSA